MKRITNLKAIVLSALCAIFALSSNAQEFETTKGKQTVFIDYFSRAKDTPYIWAEMLRGNVIAGINATNRLNLINVDARPDLAIEKSTLEARPEAAGDDMDRMKEMAAEGATYVIQGQVTSITTEENKTSDGSKYYKASCSYTLKVTNLANGTELLTMTFKHGGSGLGKDLFISGSTPDEAVAKICKKATKSVVKFIENGFQVKGQLIEIEIEKRGKVRTFYADLGSGNGVAKDTYFEVGIIRTIAGKSSFKVIGEAEVEKVESEELSLCKVKDGGEEIKKALDEGNTVFIRSTVKDRGILGDITSTVGGIAQ